MKTHLAATIAAALGLVAPTAFGQQASSCAGHHAGVAARGDQVMGFDHEKTTHHFRLTRTGGSIEVSANDPADVASRDAIRSHLAHIATMFSNGDFEAPMLIHARVPPGVPVMKEKRSVIAWTYGARPSGGRIRIATEDPEVRRAIHDFLRFQIEDHSTGDPIEIGDDPPAEKSAPATRRQAP